MLNDGTGDDEPMAAPERVPADEYLAAYAAVHDRLAQLVRADDGSTPVPACPGWRIRDVIAHLAGLCEDWGANRLDRYASDEWTARQVSRHADRSLPQILEIWASAMTTFETLETDRVGGPPARWAFGDAVIHEADIRGALHLGQVPHEAVLLSVDASIARWRKVLIRPGLRTLRIRTPDARGWWIGVEDDPNAVVVESTSYEVFRALAGRRSARQVRDWSWSADATLVLEAGLPHPFRWASSDLED